MFRALYIKWLVWRLIRRAYQAMFDQSFYMKQLGLWL
jgi:hypothetical protein